MFHCIGVFLNYLRCYRLSILYGFEVLRSNQGNRRHTISTRTGKRMRSIKHQIDKDDICAVCITWGERGETLPNGIYEPTGNTRIGGMKKYPRYCIGRYARLTTLSTAKSDMMTDQR